MIVNKCSENLLTKSKKLYENYRDNCTVVQRMLEKYKKIYPNISCLLYTSDAADD